MLKKKNKVDKSLFVVVVKRGSGYFSQNASLKVLKTADNNCKFGISVSKKELKKATDRNLLKRRVLSILKNIKPKISVKAGFGCVIFLKKGAIDIPYQKLQDEIVFLLKKQIGYSD